MKRTILTTIAVLSLLSACQGPEIVPDPVVVIPEGATVLQDTKLGMYYGDLKHDGLGVFSLVLSDARCYQDELDNPYIDSEGDMLVLRFRTPLLEDAEPIAIPSGEYNVSDTLELNTVTAAESYMKRLTGSSQAKWDIKSGTVTISRNETGEYSILTKDMVIARGEQTDTVEYACVSNLEIADYMYVAPAMISLSDDIIDMPFPRLDCIYNGNLFASNTGSFVLNFSTKGFVDDQGNVADIPGVYITLSAFSYLFQGKAQPHLKEGRYNVATATNDALFKEWSILPGLMYETSPFGSYLLQQTTDGEYTMEFISTGYMDVKYDQDPSLTTGPTKACTLTYSFKTSSRTVSGVWKGNVTVDNQAEGTSGSYLSTLEDDVECNMSKTKTTATLRKIETLHRDNVKPEWDYDIAEAWQLYLEPRDWTAEEKAIPWVDTEEGDPLGPDGKAGTEDDYMYDKNNNGIRDRLEAYCADGDWMILEFILPLGSEGQFAPELDKEYTYVMQPNLVIDHQYYDLYASKMGRPDDGIFDMKYANDNPGWAEFLYYNAVNDDPEGKRAEAYDRCNGRRGFTWSTDGYRGNWYMHYEENKHQILDGFAPAINGWVKVTRTAEDKYDFKWNFIDDYPGTANKITGSINGVQVHIAN